MTTTITAPRISKYRTRCATCTEYVEPGEGHLTGTRGAWLVRHAAPCQPTSTPTTPESVSEIDQLSPGMYRREGDIFKVQQTQDKARLYAKRLVPFGGKRLIDADESTVRFEFEYDRGAIHTLRAADRMTLDEAKAFGIRYGVCCVCNTRLTDAKSVALGIGPVCGGRV